MRVVVEAVETCAATIVDHRVMRDVVLELLELRFAVGSSPFISR
jgi:hypothetical protein